MSRRTVTEYAAIHPGFKIESKAQAWFKERKLAENAARDLAIYLDRPIHIGIRVTVTEWTYSTTAAVKP